MNKRLLIAVAVVALATVQVAWAQPVTTVAVTPTAAGDIAVNPPTVRIEGRGQSNIRFELQGSGFSFIDKIGIKIDREVVSETDLRAHGQGVNQTEVGPCQRVENGRAMNCPNRHTRAGFYKYTINLLGRDGKPLKPKDPVIVNR